MNSLAYSIIYPFIPIYLHEERNLPMDQVGMIFPLMGLAIIVTPPFSGVLADRIGRRFLMQFGQTSRAGMFLLLAALAYWNAPFWIFAVGLMINAGIGTFFQVGADAYLADISTPEERTHAYSKIRIGTNIGWAVGPMLGAFLARTPFALMFVMTALLCIFGARYTGWCCPTEPARNAAARAAEAEHHISFRTVAADHRLTRILGCSFLLFLLTSQLYSVMSVYGTSVVGISRDALGLIYSLNGFAIITCQMPVTRLLDRFGLLPLRRLVMGAAFLRLRILHARICRKRLDDGGLGFHPHHWRSGGAAGALHPDQLLCPPQAAPGATWPRSNWCAASVTRSAPTSDR
ncbi:MAG: MFS transporter [Lentisphaeria bacterium]|nr:MAG: MFS transporter [Lentisphaeria bacterium]